MTDAVQVPIKSLRFGLSPRFSQQDAAHVALLSETLDHLPPILVHRQTMAVIDGVHRTLAAQRQGRDTVPAHFFDGDDDEAFLCAVTANIAHGKPLTLEERESAAERILRNHMDWSDRRLASICGLSASSVATLRRSIACRAQLNSRVGTDGRRRPEDPAGQRLQIAELLKASPERSLRSVAAAVGASPATVLDVKERLQRGDDPLPPRLRGRPDSPSQTSTTTSPPSQPLGWLSDAALLSADQSARFAAWFDGTAVADDQWAAYVDAIPLSRVYAVIDEVLQRADSWRRFSEALSGRLKKRRSERG